MSANSDKPVLRGVHPEERERRGAQDDASNPARRFRVTLVRVMSVQIVTLALLWYLQYIFTP